LTVPFDVVERSVTPPEQWENPCNTQRFEAFFALENAKRGLLVSTEGLHEYEVLRNGDTMALTLLRCVGELGDWGEFATPIKILALSTPAFTVYTKSGVEPF